MNMRAKIKYLFILIALGALTACHQPSKTNIQLQTVNDNGYWAYEISINNKRYIYQDYIPAVQGNKRFENKRDAELVGRLVMKKILNKETPTVDTGELKQLDIKGTS